MFLKTMTVCAAFSAAAWISAATPAPSSLPAVPGDADFLMGLNPAAIEQLPFIQDAFKESPDLQKKLDEKLAKYGVKKTDFKNIYVIASIADQKGGIIGLSKLKIEKLGQLLSLLDTAVKVREGKIGKDKAFYIKPEGASLGGQTLSVKPGEEIVLTSLKPGAFLLTETNSVGWFKSASAKNTNTALTAAAPKGADELPFWFAANLPKPDTAQAPNPMIPVDFSKMKMVSGCLVKDGADYSLRVRLYCTDDAGAAQSAQMIQMLVSMASMQMAQSQPDFAKILTQSLKVKAVKSQVGVSLKLTKEFIEQAKKLQSMSAGSGADEIDLETETVEESIQAAG